MRWQEHIERKPGVMMGKPVIRGTRITVEVILERLGAGSTEADLLQSYPHLTAADLRAAQSYAAVALGSDEMVFLTSADR